MKGHTLSRLPLLLLILMAFSPLTSQAIDAPHNTANTISCNSCHDSSLPDSPLLSGSDINNFCTANCHFEPANPYTSTSAPKVATHSSATTSTTYGVWTKLCTDCHDPHNHNQKNWKKSNASDLYLVRGTLASYVFDNNGTPADTTDDTTVITYSGGTFKGSWTAASIKQKTSAARGGILLPNVNKLGFTYVLTDMTDNGEANGSKTGTITVKGDLSPAYQYISTPTTFAIILGNFLKQYIDTDGNGSDETPVKLLDKSGSFSYGMGNGSGVCEVCHTQTKHFRKNGTGGVDPDHTNMGSVIGTNCMNCHAHTIGFKGLGHKDTHFTWAAVGGTDCTYCHTNNGNGVVNDAHGNNCSPCHSSVPPNRNNNAVGNATNGVDGDATVAQAEGIAATANGDLDHVIWQQPTCAHCHTGYDLSTVHHDSKNNYATNGNCTQCHEDSKNYAGNHTALVTLPTNCDDCHSGTEGTAGPVFNISVSAANNMKHDSCLDCHNADANGTLKAAYGVAQAIPDGGAGSNNGGGSCLVCHTTIRDDFTAHGNENHSELTGTGTNCTGCHSGDLITGNKIHALSLANDAAAGNNTTNACLDCHLNTTTDGSFVVGTGAGTPHGATSVGVSNAGAIGSTRTCNTCHASYATTFGNSGAHREEDHSGITGAGSTCTSCHTGNMITAVHDQASAGGTAPCLKCHTNLTNNGTLKDATVGDATGHVLGVNSTCDSCHTVAKGGPSGDFDGGSHANYDHSGVTANTNCTTCHVGDKITGTYTHNNICTNCHNNIAADGSLVDGVTGAATGDVGDATGHTFGGSSDCVDCHTVAKGGPGGDFDGGSHADYDHSGISGTAACTGCHNGNMITGANVHNSVCANCHTNIVANGTLVDGTTGAATGDVGDATVHALGESNTCLDCHDVSLGGPGTDFDGGSHANYDHSGVTLSANCTGCHTGDKITGTYTHNNNCQACHTNITTNGSLVDGAVGTATGDVGDASAHTIGTSSSCDTCHTVAKGGPSGDFDGGSHADYNHSGISGNAACTGCHTGNIITGTYTHNSNCTDCHTNIVGNGTLVDGSVGIFAGDVGDATVHALGETNDCLDCHDVSLGGPGGDFDGGSHANYNHSGITGNALCTGCHNGNIITGANTHNSNCTDCHTNILGNGTLIDGSVGTFAGDVGDATVHALGETNNCVDCHALALGGPGGDFDGGSHANYNHSGIAGAASHCTGCHTGNIVSAVHSSTTTGNNTVETCTDCHNDPLNADGTLLNGTEKSVVQDGPYGATKIGDASVHVLGVTSSCDTCHSVPLGDGSCYFEQNLHQGRHSQITFAFNNSCVNCHDQGSTATENFLIATIHGTTGCGNCHNATTHVPETKTNADASVAIGGGTFECLGCHGGQGTTDNYTSRFQDAHDVKDHSGVATSANCVGCHTGDKITGTYTHNNNCQACHTNTTTNGTLVDGAVGTATGDVGDATGHTIGASSTCDNCHTVAKGGPSGDFDGGSHADYDHSGLGNTASCVTCHTGNMITAVHNSNCAWCHTNIVGNGTLVAGSVATTYLGTTNVGTAAGHTLGSTSTCASCHAAYATNYTNHLQNHTNHADHAAHLTNTSGATDYCYDCHKFADDVNGDGVGTTMIADIHGNECDNCHTPTTGVLHNGNLAASYDTATKHGDATASFVHSGSRACVVCHTKDANGTLIDGESHAVQNLTSLQTAHNNIGTVAGCSSCHEDDDVTERLALHMSATTDTQDCLTCHTDTDVIGAKSAVATINEGKSVLNSGTNTAKTCSDCHAAKADNSLHGLTSSTVSDVHNTFSTSTYTAERKCSNCHTMITTQQRINLHAACTTCHARHATVSDTKTNVINDGRETGHVVGQGGQTGGQTKNCESCHTGKGIYALHGLSDDNTDTGNGVNDTVVDIHDNFNSSTGTTPTYTGKLSGAYGGLKVTAYNCADCHSSTRTGITDQEAMFLHTRENQVNNGVGYGDCRTCHTANGINNEVSNGRYDRADASTPVAGLGNNQTIECEDCHKTAYDANSPSGQKMYQYDGARHHTTGNAQAGNCTYCHADPRPSTPTLATGYASTATAASSDNGVSTYNNGWVNASDFGLTAPASGIPKQPACRICHTNYGTDGAGTAWSVNVNASTGNFGYNIAGYSGTATERTTGLTVYANDFNAQATNAGDNTTASVNATRTTQTVLSSHRINANDGASMIKVFDYGACFSCHSVQIMHASPKPGVDYPTPASITTIPWDTLRHAPGRAIFFLLRGTNTNTQAWNDHRLQNQNGIQNLLSQSLADPRGKTYIRSAESGTGWYFNGNIAGDTTVTDPPLHASITDFEGLGTATSIIKFADIGATTMDRLYISRAEWNGADVVVEAYSTIGSGQAVNFTYTGAGGPCNTAMTWDGAKYAGTCAAASGWTATNSVTVTNTTTTPDSTETKLVTGFTAAAAAADTLDGLTDDTASLQVMGNDSGTGIFLYSLDDSALNANCSAAISGTQVALTCGGGWSGSTGFDYTIMDEQGGTSIATVSLTVAVNNAPTLTINEPAGGNDSVTKGKSWNINYDLADAEEAVTVAFYYDTDAAGLNGTLAANCSAAIEGTGANCAWDTTGVAGGSYYIYGVTSDGIHTNVTDYSSGVVSIIPPVELLAAGAGSTENYSGTADSGNITYNIAGSAADNRLLVVSIAVSDTFTSQVSGISATYGGQALTEITENTTSNMGSVWMGYLKETGIAAASNSTLAFNNNNTTWDTTKVQIMTFKNVNQTTPLIGAASQSGSIGAVSRVTASLTMGERDMPVYAAVSRNTGGHTVSTTASGTMTELFEELNSASLSSGYKADVKTATSGTITVTFGATEDCAINAAVLRNINN